MAFYGREPKVRSRGACFSSSDSSHLTTYTHWLWEASYDELSQEYRAKLLPPSHVLTQHVHRVVSRILEANDLGTLRGDLRVPTPPRGVLQSAFGFGGNGESEEVVPDLWDPDSAGHGSANGFGKKEWNLLVVNDQKVVNAMAAPGKFLKLFMPP